MVQTKEMGVLAVMLWLKHTRHCDERSEEAIPGQTAPAHFAFRIAARPLILSLSKGGRSQ
jgi:hypothetical protein